MIKFKGLFLGMACALGLMTTAQAQVATPKLGKASIKDVVAAMTLEEKIEFIHGIGMGVTGGGNGPVAGSVAGRVPGAAGLTQTIDRLGIPAIIMADGPAGLRIDTLRQGESKRYYTTAFPTGTILASTWNPALIEQVGRVMGNEVKEYGVDVLLAPGVNIQRNLLCGRNYEYYSEDPFLTGRIGAAFVNGVQSNGVGTSVKHFAVNSQETGRAYVDAVVGERALREIYLRAFQYIVKTAQPWTVMSSYNKVNGTYASESKRLLTTILRDEWGFKGMVTTDWFAGRNYPAQVEAGNDLLMPGRKQETKKITAAIKAGKLDVKELDRNIERILELVIKCPSFLGYQYSNNPDLAAHSLVAREAAAEGMVLLKNQQNALPVASGNICLLGNASYATYVGGTGSGEVASAHNISIEEGLETAGLRIDKSLKNLHLQYIAEEKAKQPARTNILQKINVLPERAWSQGELEQLAKNTDACIITIGRNAGEGSDRKVDVDYSLSASERALIDNASEVFHRQGKKVTVILNIDGVIDASTWADKADAILVAWLPGVQAGNATADVLTGKVNPSGKLAITFPQSYKDVPSESTFPGVPAERPDSTVYNEGIYVGYRHCNTHHVAPAYEFGYGLSYTTFSIDKVKLSSKKFNGKLVVTANVRNTGKTAGKEVVQLYLSAPTDKIDKPTEELKGFAKTKLLKPGESQKVSFTLTPDELASFNTEAASWVADKGEYIVKVGNSSRNFKQTAKFSLAEDIVVEKCHK